MYVHDQKGRKKATSPRCKPVNGYTAANTLACQVAVSKRKETEPAKESSGSDISVSRLGARFWAYPRCRLDQNRNRIGDVAARPRLIPGSLWFFIGAATTARSRVLTANKTYKRTDHVHESELCILNNDFFFLLFFRYDERNILGTLFGKKVLVQSYFRELVER